MKVIFATFLFLLFMQLVCISVAPPPLTHRTSIRSGSSSPSSPRSPTSSPGRSTNKAKALLQRAGSSVRSGANRFAKGAYKLGHELAHGDSSYQPHSIVAEGPGRHMVNAQYN